VVPGVAKTDVLVAVTSLTIMGAVPSPTTGNQPPVTAATPPSNAPASSAPATPPSATPTSSAPAPVVQRYWNDINTGNFEDAWSLGRSNLQPSVSSESAFAAQNVSAVGTTSVTITGVVDNQVYVNLSSGGNTFSGSYTVFNGIIVSGNIQKTS
jgi:hypothetical protein